jgi:hypothetical protein
VWFMCEKLSLDVFYKVFLWSKQPEHM